MRSVLTVATAVVVVLVGSTLGDDSSSPSGPGAQQPAAEAPLPTSPPDTSAPPSTSPLSSSPIKGSI